MRVSSSVVAAVSLVAGVAAQDSSCHDYVLISIRGTGERQGPSLGFVQMVNSTLEAVPNGLEYDVVYPAARNQSFQFGSQDAVRYINDGLKSCPKQAYALLGYSQGASAVMGALMNYTDTASDFYKALKAIVVIGNPYHVPNASANVDQFAGDSTNKYAGALYSASTRGSQGIPKLYYDDGKLLDICFQADIVCATAYPNSSWNAHIGYIGNGKVQSMGSEHIISRLTGTNTTTGWATSTNSSGTNSTTGTNTTVTGSSTSSVATSPTPTGAANGIVFPSFLLAAGLGFAMAIIL